MELTARTGRLAGSLAVKDSDEVLAISSKGRMIRIPVEGISIMKRHSVGNIILRLDEGDSLADCSVIRTEDDENDDTTAPIPFDDEGTNEDENS